MLARADTTSAHTLGGGNAADSVGVSIRSVSLRFGAFKALDDVSLDVAPGELVSLLGPSGSGKTSLLNVLGGFAVPTAGSVWFGEGDVSGDAATPCRMRCSPTSPHSDGSTST